MKARCVILYTQRAFLPNERCEKMNIEMFTEYDDVVSVADVANMLHISKVTVYDLLKSGRIFTLRVGKRYIIPKKSIIDFLTVNPSGKRGESVG